MGVYEKLMEIQSELKVGKNLWNDYGNFKYRNCELILETAKPILKQHGCVLYLSDELMEYGGKRYIRATAHLYDCESKEEIQNFALAREADAKKGMDDSQITGTASSYARKYALQGLLALDDQKDADSNEYHEQTTEQTPKITEEKARVLREYAETVGVTEEEICQRFEVKDIEDMTMRDFTVASKMLTKTAEKKGIRI